MAITDAEKLAIRAYTCATQPTAENRKELLALIKRLKKEEVKNLEHRYDVKYRKLEEGPWKGLIKLLLRTHIRRSWKNHPAESSKLLALLEEKNPQREKPKRDAKPGSLVLSFSQRREGIEVARKLNWGVFVKNKEHRRQLNYSKRLVKADALAAWIFKDAVWKRLCSKVGGGVRYPYTNLSNVRTVINLFRTPTQEEVNYWTTKSIVDKSFARKVCGAEKFLFEIAKNIDRQTQRFSEEMGWIMYPKGTEASGIAVISGLVKKIRNYQKAWEGLGRATKTLGQIKDLLMPSSNYMKYLWSEQKRLKLRLWKKYEKHTHRALRQDEFMVAQGRSRVPGPFGHRMRV